MANIIRNGHLWIGVGLVALYWGLAYVLPFYVLYEFVVSLLIGLSAVVVLLYAPIALRAIAAGPLDRLGQLSMGITVTMASLLAARSWHLIWRARGKPDAMIESDWVTFFFFIALVGSFLHATAPSAGVSDMPRRSLWMLVSAVAGGALLAGYIIGAGWAH